MLEKNLDRKLNLGRDANGKLEVNSNPQRPVFIFCP
jgi:hypothetical protein